MNGKISKKIRRKIYGAEGSSRVRQYHANMVKTWREIVTDALGKLQEVVVKRFTLTAGPQRNLYQRAKKWYMRFGTIPERHQL